MSKKITLKINKKPKLNHGKMKCDTGIHKRLDEFELTKCMNKACLEMKTPLSG